MYPITLFFNIYIEQFINVLKETFIRNKIGIVVEGVLVSFLFRFLDIIGLLAISVNYLKKAPKDMTDYFQNFTIKMEENYFVCLKIIGNIRRQKTYCVINYYFILYYTKRSIGCNDVREKIFRPLNESKSSVQDRRNITNNYFFGL